MEVGTRDYLNFEWGQRKQMTNNPELTPSVRMAALQWLMRTCSYIGYQRYTCHYAINMFDRYLLHAKDIPAKDMALVAAGCLDVARHTERLGCPEDTSFHVLSLVSKKGDEIQERFGQIRANICETLDLKDRRETRIDANAIMESLVDEEYAPGTNERDELFDRCAQVLDLALLSSRCLHFFPRVLAESVLFYGVGYEREARYSDPSIQSNHCRLWLRPYLLAIHRHGPGRRRTSFKMVADKDNNVRVLFLQSMVMLPGFLEPEQYVELGFDPECDDVEGQGTDQPQQQQQQQRQK